MPPKYGQGGGGGRGSQGNRGQGNRGQGNQSGGGYRGGQQGSGGSQSGGGSQAGGSSQGGGGQSYRGGQQGGSGQGYRGGQQGGGNQGYRGGQQGAAPFGRGRPTGQGDLPFRQADNRGRGGSPSGNPDPLLTPRISKAKYNQRETSRARSLYTDASGQTQVSSEKHEKPKLFDQRGAMEAQIHSSGTEAESKLILRPADPKSMFPKRPGYGTAHVDARGLRVPNTEVLANYLRIQFKGDKNTGGARQPIHRYSIATPEKLPKGKMRVLAKRILQNRKFDGVSAATDFSGIIVTNKKLDLGIEDAWTGEADIRDPEDNARAPQLGNTGPNRSLLPFEVKHTGTFTLEALVSWISGDSRNAQFPQREELLQILNIVFGYYALHNREHVFQVGNSNKFYYDSFINQNVQELGAGLRALRGYIASVRLSPGSLLLNLNVVSGAFYKLGPLRFVAWQLLRGDKQDYDPEKLTNTEKHKLESMLKLVRIECHYMPLLGSDGQPRRRENGAIMRKKVIRNICGFNPPDYLPPSRQRVQIQDPSTGQTRDMTVMQYFKEKYPDSGFDNDHGWPCVNVGTRAKPTWIPLELCMMSPAQAVRRMLAPSQTSTMIKFAARAPHRNAERIVTEGVPMFKLSMSEQTNAHAQFGLEIPGRLIKVPARFLSAPGLAYAQGRSPEMGEAAWNLKGVRFYKPAKIPKAGYIEIQRITGAGQTLHHESLVGYPPGKVTEIMTHQWARYGLNIGGWVPLLCAVPGGGTFVNSSEYQKRINVIFEKLAAQEIKIAIWALDEVSAFTYSFIKKMGDTKYGIHSVCMFGEKLNRAIANRYGVPDVGFFANIALKVNIKSGGINHFLTGTELNARDKGIWNDTTMFIGIDVTHPAPGNSKATPSIAAVVANTDAQLAQWPGSIRRQNASREEMVDALKDMVMERLQLWKQKNGNKLPTRLIVYRDGVSDGQFALVLQHERKSINQAIEAVYKGIQRPQLAMITVTKRHHTRLYPANREDMDKGNRETTGNCRPGLVVDRGVTDPEVYDFFLQPHAGLQGTVKPARYVVLHDELKMGPDGLQKMTHTLCYLFSRATRAVSLCPPAYYADLLAERARCYLYHTYTEGSIGATADTDEGGISEWNGTLHDKIMDTTFYI
ncbi:Piwi domain-containing protein 1 [Elsinoe fawcettii]|nr:Piwi domain-containing protein 1 [Elsinoe fawcettii]